MLNTILAIVVVSLLVVWSNIKLEKHLDKKYPERICKECHQRKW